MCVCRVRHTRPDHPSSTILHGDRARPSPRERKRFLARPRERERGRRKEEEEEERKDKGGERERKSRRNRAWRKRDNARVATSSNYLFVPFLVHFLLLPLLSSFIAARIDEGGPFRKAKLYARESGEHRAEKCSARTSERASERAGGRTVERRAIVSWVYLNSVSAG